MSEKNRSIGDLVSAARVDRTVFEFGTLDDDGEREYRLSRTSEERLERRNPIGRSIMATPR